MNANNALLRAILLAALISGANAQAGPIPTTPEARAFKIGALPAWSLHDAQFTAANDGLTFGIGVPTASVADVLKSAGAPTDMITLSVNALLVKSPKYVMLFDTGLGAKLGGGLIASLALAGVKPDQVTDILITHSHGDHIGGLAADGKLVFPNATIRMSEKEWAFMKMQTPTLSAIVAPKVVAFIPDIEVLPGVTPMAVAGHTPGHVVYAIASAGHRLIDLGDTAHSSIISLAKPDWAMGYDTDKIEGKAARREELGKLAASHAEVFAPHFPYPGIGKVVHSGGGFAWKPEVMKLPAFR